MKLPQPRPRPLEAAIDSEVPVGGEARDEEGGGVEKDGHGEDGVEEVEEEEGGPEGVQFVCWVVVLQVVGAC